MTHKNEFEEQPNEERRKFLEKAGKVAVAAPTVMFLVSATNPQLALGYGNNPNLPRQNRNRNRNRNRYRDD